MLNNLSKIADSQAKVEKPAPEQVKDYKVTLVKGTNKFQVVDSKSKPHIFGSMGHALAFKEKIKKLKDDEEVPVDENEEVPEDKPEELVEVVKDLLEDNSLEEVLEAVVEASNEEAEAKDSIKLKIKQHFNPVKDSVDLAPIRAILAEAHMNGSDPAFSVEEKEDGTICVEIESGLSDAEEEAVNEAMHLLGYAVVMSEADGPDGKTDCIEYKPVTADSKKETPAAMTKEVKDAKVADFRKKLCDTTTTEEAIKVAKDAMEVDGLPAGDVIQEVIEVLSDVIENVQEEEEEEGQMKPSEFTLEQVQGNPKRFLDQKDGIFFDQETGTFWHDGNTFLKLPQLLEYKAAADSKKTK